MYLQKYNLYITKLESTYCKIGAFMLKSERCKKSRISIFHWCCITDDAGGEGVNRIDACAAEKI